MKRFSIYSSSPVLNAGWWLQEANKPVFDKYFGNIRTANFAVAGDTTQGASVITNILAGSMTNLRVGTPVKGPGIQAGATITSLVNSFTSNSLSNTSGSITISGGTEGTCRRG